MLLAPHLSRSLFVIALCATGLLSGCTKENSTDVAIAQAQACLDQAVGPDQADACSAKVANIQTPKAYMIRCSANLLAQGFTGARIANAYQQMKNPPSGANASAVMLSYFVFSNDLANNTPAITNTNCTASEDASLTGIGNLVNTASIIASFAASGNITGSIAGSPLDPSSPSFNPAQLQSAVSSAYTANDPNVNAAVGQLATSAASTYCAAGNALSTQDVCTKLTSAVNSGNGSSANIGYALLNLLKQ